MAEFQEVMRQFDRMCWYYRRECKCPMGCPMDGLDISQCRKIAFEEPLVTEKTIMDWAKANPEPVYPTWYEWLTDQAVIVAGERGCYGNILPTNKIFAPIPTDIAQKMGIKPKEG